MRASELAAYKHMQGTEIEKKQETVSLTPEGLMLEAIKNGNVDAMAQLMSMRREFKDEAAREAFAADMAMFQAECPVIKKGRGVLNKDKQSIRYKFSPYEDITDETRDLRSRYGFPTASTPRL